MSQQPSSKERVHDLKCWPQYFAAVLDGSKPFEIRVNDRDYLLGDLLRLREWRYSDEQYTGREITKRVTFITSWAQQDNHVVMGLADVRPAPEPSSALEALEHTLKVFRSLADRGRYPIELLPELEGEPNPYYLGKQGWEYLTDAIAKLRNAQPPCGHAEHAAVWHRLVQSIATILEVDSNGSADEVGKAIADKIRAPQPPLEPFPFQRLLGELDEYLSRSPAEAVHAGSILHQKIKQTLGITKVSSLTNAEEASLQERADLRHKPAEY